MKAIRCEMCGSNDILKSDGYYVCQSCGTKYSPEDAKNLLVEGIVQIDNTEKITNLYVLARRARENNNATDAEKYYDEIRKDRPNDWEANFFAVYFKAFNCKLGEISSAAKSVAGCIHSTFQLIDECGLDTPARIKAFELVSKSCMDIAEMLGSAETNRYFGIDSSIRYKYSADHDRNINAIASIRFNLWDEYRYTYVDDETIMRGVGLQVLKYRVEQYVNNADSKQIVTIIQKYEPDYIADTSEVDAVLAESEKLKKEIDDFLKKNDPNKNQGGCYIATAVYGSYDCPQVWTLRRFRDYKLADSLLGRMFVRFYYSVSPALVRRFGHTTLFIRLWKNRLDKLVLKLNKLGYDDTPYKDIDW